MKWYYSLIFLTSIFVLVSCKKDEPAPTPEPEITENYNPPSDNAKILGEVFHNSFKNNSYYDILSLNDGNFIVYGVEHNSTDGKNFIKKINSSGNAQWSISIDMNIRQIQLISPNQYVAVGGLDNNADNKLENATIVTFDGSGNILDQKSKSNNNATIYLNGATKITSTGDSLNLFCYGGAIKSSVYYPHALNIKITSVGKILFGTALDNSNAWKEGIDYNQANKVYSIITKVDNSIISCLNVVSSTGTALDQFFIQKSDFKVSLASLSETSVVGSLKRSFKVLNNELYICGSIKDNSSPAASSGYIWSDGMIAKVNSSGSIIWKQTLPFGTIKKYDEEIQSIDLANGKVYFAGQCSNFYNNKSLKYFGNGYAGTLDAANGSILSTMSFGDKTYQSGINSCAYYGAQLFNVGYTKYSKSGEGFQGWFFKVNL